MADKGTGVAITFDSGYFANATSVSLTVNREEVDVTTLATAGGKVYEPSDLYSAEMDVEMLFAPGTTPDVLDNAGSAGNITLTFSDAGAAAWAATAFMRNLQISASDVDDRVRGTAQMRISGNITITP